MIKTFKSQVLATTMILIAGIVSLMAISDPVFAQPTAQTIQPGAIATLLSFPGTRPSRLGVKEGHLTPCPTSPNCVSSQGVSSQGVSSQTIDDPDHDIAPLAYEGSATEAFDRLKLVLETFDNAEIVDSDDHYLYAEFTIPVFGFVDDVEFYLDEATAEIQVRSASRLGESDLG